MQSPIYTELEKEFALFGGITDRKLAALRLILATAALLIIFIDPAEPSRFVTLTNYSLIAYTAYSFLIYWVARRCVNFSGTVLRTLTWTDVACYSVLISLSSGTNSVFFFFYLFAIIVASSRGGARLGLSVTIASAALCVGVTLLATPPNQIELNRFLIRPLAIFALGYILAYWGGTELVLKRRLALLRELSLIANPRFGVDRTIERMLQRLSMFYDAEFCCMLLDTGANLQFYRVAHQILQSDSSPTVPFEDHKQIPLIHVADPVAAVYSRRLRVWSRQPSYREYDPQTRKVISRSADSGEALAEFLNVQSFVAVPFQRERLRGRLVISSAHSNAFDLGDAIFLHQVANQVLPVIENIRLVDRLASDASEDERNRIARSVHDRVIQPYYGLKIGLRALRDLLESNHTSNGNGHSSDANNSRPVALLDQLTTMTSEGIDELRQYIHGLKQSQSGQTRLVDSILRFARKFESATGIQVNVRDESDGMVTNDRLTAEVFQMTAEALSNVHRHTQTRTALVTLALDQNNLILQIENETGKDSGPVTFTPVSISERVTALGGRVDVLWFEGRTILRMAVPL